MRRTGYLKGMVVLAVCAVWVFGANRAGLFIRNREKVASQPNESAMEPFSQTKKFASVGSWKVAYIDRGSGDPNPGPPLQGNRAGPSRTRRHSRTAR